MKRKETSFDVFKKIKNILDLNYFHICVTAEESKTKWIIYYKNLPHNDYFSKENTELLSSNEHTFEDIYKLKNKFESEKQKIVNENFKELMSIKYNTFKVLNSIKRKFYQFIIDFLIIVTLATIFNLFTFQNKEFSILIFLLTAFGVIFLIIEQEKLDKAIDKAMKKMNENFIKEKIKRQGLYFMKRLQGGSQ